MTPEQMEEEVRRLKKSMNAVILAHYYQESEMQDLADFVGDSLALAQQAAKTQADVIVFCGVHFMAETAKILNPTKTGAPAGSEGGLLARGPLPSRAVRRVQAQAPRPLRRQLRELLRRGEGDERRHLHLVERGEDREPGPEGSADPLRARPAPRPLRGEADRPRDDPLAGQLHRPRDLQREAARPAQGRAPRRRGGRAPRVRAAGARATPTTSARRRGSSTTW